MSTNIAFNSLFKDADEYAAEVRTQPSGSLETAKPEPMPNPKQSESAESAMDPDDFKGETNIPANETRSDEKQQAQKEGERQRTGGGGVKPKKQLPPVTEVDEEGRPLWVGPQTEEDLLWIPVNVSQARRAITGTAGQALKDTGAAIGEAGAATLGPALNAAKEEVMDVAEGVGSTVGAGLSGISSGVVQQMNTMLIILGLAYVAGQAIGSK